MFFKSILLTLVSTFFIYNSVFASVANLIIYHEDPTKPVSQFVIKYGPTEEEHPIDYPYTKTYTLPTPSTGAKSTIQLEVGAGISGCYYFSVNDIYSDATESGFSENSFPICIPATPANVRIVE